MKSLNILLCLLQDASRSLGANTTRDWVTIQSRFQHEGLSFLTITLPAYSSWLEQSLEEGHLLQSIYQTFRRKRNGVSPCFLQGLTELVFDRDTGDLLIDASPLAVRFIRSICSSFKKVKLPCSKRREEAAIKKFEDTDFGLPDAVRLDNVTQSVANVVIEDLKFFLSELALPRHGKGATFEKITGNRKYSIREFYDRWSDVISPEDLYGWNRIGEGDISRLSEEEEKPCRLSLVPKTLKSPRIIAVEPTAMQYAQQSLALTLIESMKGSRLTRHIDFTDQSVNREHARKGSIDRSVSTIDLSEASDRVSLSLVSAVFSSDPELLALLLAFRSRKVLIPKTTLRPRHLMELKKYSTSGSALTFPVETLVFFILALSALVKEDLHRYRTLKTAIYALAQSVSVFGDDIVAPSHTCSRIIRDFDALGLKVNSGKTFWKGSFRESCGGDYFRGTDVTPIYIRHMLPSSSRESDSVCSSVATANLFFSKGLWYTADCMRKAVDSIRPLPVVLATCPGLGWTWGGYDRWKVLPNFHVGVRTFVVSTKPVEDILDGYSALLKHFVSRAPIVDAKHLSQTVPRFRTTLRLKWVTPY